MRREAAGALAAAHDHDNEAATAAARDRFLQADARMLRIRRQASDLVRRTTGDAGYDDVNYVFPTFVTTRMPPGLVGLLIAAIFAAAMSSIAAELNALSTATLIDFYRRWLKPEAPDRHYLLVSRAATAVWSVVASAVALYAATLGSLIEVVNRFGSFFYGSLLGVFVLAIGTRRATGTGAFVGLLAGMASVAFVAFSISPNLVSLAQRRRRGRGGRRRPGGERGRTAEPRVRGNQLPISNFQLPGERCRSTRLGVGRLGVGSWRC